MALKFDNPTDTISSQTTNGDLNLSGNGTGAVVVDGRLGVGTSVPQVLIHAYGSTPQLRLQEDDVASGYLDIFDSGLGHISKIITSGAATIDVDPTPTDGTSEAKIRIFRTTNTTAAVFIDVGLGSGVATYNARLAGKGTSSYVSLSSGNFGIRSNAFGTSSVGVVSIGNGTAPTSSPANSVQLYAKDVSSSSELFVRDEAGNQTQLSPHAAGSLEEAFPGADDKSVPLPMVIHHRNEYVGCEEWIHLSQLAQAVEELTGKKFIYRRPLEKRDWKADQNVAREEQQAKIDKWEARKAEWEANHDNPFDDEKPQSYQQATLPPWLLERIATR